MTKKKKNPAMKKKRRSKSSRHGENPSLVTATWGGFGRPFSCEDGQMLFDPKNETIAYLIWAYCKPRGWGDTVPEIAAAIGLPMTTVRGVVRGKGWNHRLPKVRTTEPPRTGDFRVAIDMQLDDWARM
jgi:hypothetical protein